jgi:hypothetical protein
MCARAPSFLTFMTFRQRLPLARACHSLPRMAASTPTPQPLSTAGRTLLALALVSSLAVFLLTVWPALGGTIRPRHADHWGWVLLHTLTGLIMLVTGPLNLWIGETRRGFEWHRHVGCTYIGAGYTATLAALAVNWRNPHGNLSIALSTTLLALAWMLTASMGWRTGARKRFAAHRSWMIRSYVLTWSFVLCRLVQRTQAASLLGEGGVALVVWLTWLGPLLLCEIALQWRRLRGTAQA